MSAAGSIIKVFISYCRQDEKLKQKLIDHLSLFKRQAIISISDSYSSEVSLEWTTNKYLDSSDLILLLISPAYMASDYCYDIEMVRAMERYEAGEAHVIPIILRPCYWQPAPFGKLLALPKHFKPITEWPNQEAAFTDIVKNIGRVLKDLQTFGYSRSTTPIPVLTPISELSPYSSFTIYISFAWEDELMEREVESHLQMLQRQALITIWHSDMISPGNDWEQEINSHLHRAQIILLLVSRNYLTDEFHYDMEMRRAMERYEAGEARVIPIILSPCNWQPAPFGKLLALPKSGEPITTWDNSEAAFADVVKNVEIVIKELQGFGISGATTMTAIPLSKLSPDSPLSVYISFATADETMEREVESHLQMLQRQALITIWHPGMISAGRDWELEIHSHLQSAHIILLLVSQNYLTNEFLYRVEMARAMERYEAGEARVIPIILSPCDWQQAPFGKLLALPKVGKTVVEWTNREEVLAEIVKNIQIVSDELRT